MKDRRRERSDENGFFTSIKWMLTAISGALTTTLIFLLGPVAP